MKTILTLALALACLMACSEEIEPPAPAPFATGGAARITATVTFEARDVVFSNIVPDAELCLKHLGSTDCATTDAEGRATLTADFVPGELFFIYLDKEGYAPTLNEQVVPEGAAFGDTPLLYQTITADSVAVMELGAGVTVDPTKGGLTAMVDAPGTFVTVNRDAESGPNYVRPSSSFSPTGPFGDASEGVTESGFVVWLNVAQPGPASINIDGEVTCTSTTGLTDAAGDHLIMVEPGRVNFLSFTCAPR